jgi:hypothetical protein
VRHPKMHGKDLVCRAFYFLAARHFSPTGRYRMLVSKWRWSAFNMRFLAWRMAKYFSHLYVILSPKFNSSSNKFFYMWYFMVKFVWFLY